MAMGAATGREAVVAERAVGVEGMEEATAAAAQQALAGPAVKAMGSLVDRQRQILAGRFAAKMLKRE